MIGEGARALVGAPSSCGGEVWAGGALRSLAVKGPLSFAWPEDCVGEGVCGGGGEVVLW